MQLRKNSDNILTKEKGNQIFLTLRQNKKRELLAVLFFTE